MMIPDICSKKDRFSPDLKHLVFHFCNLFVTVDHLLLRANRGDLERAFIDLYGYVTNSLSQKNFSNKNEKSYTIIRFVTVTTWSLKESILSFFHMKRVHFERLQNVNRSAHFVLWNKHFLQVQYRKDSFSSQHTQILMP